MKSNERLIAALNKAIELKPDLEVGKFIRYIGSASDLAYMTDDDISRIVEWQNDMAKDYPDRHYHEFTANEKFYVDYILVDRDSLERKMYDFTKENEQISYDRYMKKVEGKIFFQLTEKLDMSDFLRRFDLSFVDAEDFEGITVINHRDVFLDDFPIEYRHMVGYIVGVKNDKYIAKHEYFVKNPCFGELIGSIMNHCQDDYDEFLGIALDWWESPRFTDYTNRIMYGFSYRKKEKEIEIYNEHQTIEKFHEYMQKANKITSTWAGVLYDDGTFIEQEVGEMQEVEVL